MLSKTYAKFYNPSEHLALNKIIILFKGRVIFKQHIPKKNKCFGVEVYKLCIMTAYSYDMSIYFGKDMQNATQIMTVTRDSEKSH
jgi:hypothetical protein